MQRLEPIDASGAIMTPVCPLQRVAKLRKQALNPCTHETYNSEPRSPPGRAGTPILESDMVYLYWSTLILFLTVCVILILLVLIQKGRGGGLAGAFGGAGGNTAFGSKTGDVLTWATSILFGVFLLLAVATNWLSNSLDAQLQNSQANAAPAGP